MEKQLIQTYENPKFLPTDGKLELWLANELPELNQTTSAFVMAFQGENIILANVHSRGWDIPGGHIENGETPEEAMHRELFEETGASLLCCGLMGYSKMTLTDKKPSTYRYPFPVSYLPVYWGMIDTIGEPSESMEVGMPKLFCEEKLNREKLLPYHMPFFEHGLARTRVFLDTLNS